VGANLLIPPEEQYPSDKLQFSGSTLPTIIYELPVRKETTAATTHVRELTFQEGVERQLFFEIPTTSGMSLITENEPTK
jgi:hypothetical protein